jgi:uncharacterized membrane protein
MSNAEQIRNYKDLLDAGVITQEEFDRKKEDLLSSFENAAYGAQAGLSARVTSIIAYITLIGLIIAFCAGDREGAKFHLNQALVIFLFSLLSLVPMVGWIWGLVMIVFWVMGLVAAINEEEKPVPLIGGIKILK